MAAGKGVTVVSGEPNLLSFRPPFLLRGWGITVDEGLLDRQERAARNQSLFREVNERVGETAHPFDPTFTSFACECANTECVEQVSLTHEEYEAVRRWPNHFVVKPGHASLEFERVLDQAGADSNRYEVVEMFGEAGKLAIELDPRRATT
jgi:hypothetical protein